MLIANPQRQVFRRPIFTRYIVSTCNLYSQNISRHLLILNFGNAVVNDNCQNCYQVSINNLSKSLSLRFLKIYRIKTDLCITSGKQTMQTEKLQIRLHKLVGSLIWKFAVCVQHHSTFHRKPQTKTLDYGHSVVFWGCNNFFFPKYVLLTLYPFVSSADNLCKQFGPRSGLTKCRA